MALDAEVSDLLKTQMLSNADRSSQRINHIAENSMQGLSLVQTTVVQAQASQTDDPGLIAALQTASRTPAQGANPAPGS